MPSYAYTAKSSPQQAVSGTIDAESEQDAVAKLAKLGYFPVSIAQEGLLKRAGNSLTLQKVPKPEVMLFTRQLASMIESGVNLIKSFDIISSQAANKHLKIIINDVLKKVKDGRQLSASLSAYPLAFPPLYTAMIHAGEISGNLAETLRRLADYLEKEDEFKNSLLAALTYPFFIIFVGAATVAVLLGFVIPRLASMFEDMGQALPLPTQILMQVSGFLRSQWWMIIVGAVIIAAVFKRFHASPKGRLAWDKSMLKTPALGPVFLKSEVARIMRTLSLLLSSGVTVVTALDIARSIADNEALKAELEQFKQKISNGLNFSDCLKESKFFPVMVTNIVSVGEETGNMEQALMRIANDYEKDTDRTLKAFTRLLEPVIILVMGLVVGFIVVSMLLPIFQINLMVR
jgi:type II secretory pathway component PulF